MIQTSRSRLRLALGAAVVASMGFGFTQGLAEPRTADAGPLVCKSTQVTCRCGLQVVACVSPGSPCPACP
jgi:hypothetical protein